MKKIHFLILFSIFLFLTNTTLAQEIILTNKGLLMSRYKIIPSETPEKTTFQYSLDDNEFVDIKTKYEGENEEGQPYWSFINQNKQKELLIKIDGGGLKNISDLGNGKKLTLLYGECITYTCKTETLTLVTTGQGSVLDYEDKKDIGSSGAMNISNKNAFEQGLKSNKDFKIEVSKFLDLEDNLITLSFQKKNTEIQWTEKGKKKIFVKK